MKKRGTRILTGVLIAIFATGGMIWLLIPKLGDHETLYEGKSLDGWAKQLHSHDDGTSNQANETLNNVIIPRLVSQMFNDTNDSKTRLMLVKAVNAIPGAHIYFIDAAGRRFAAVEGLGFLGPSAKAAVPSLIQAFNGPDAGLHDIALVALGSIHSDPDKVIPLLTSCLTNNALNEDAATALGNYGGLAREAFPKILPLLHAWDKHTRIAARAALDKIDPEAAARLRTGAPRKSGQ